MNRLDRALGIVLALRSGKEVPARRLAERLGVSSRTIYRDVQTLSALGVPIYGERGRDGGFRLLSGYFLPPIMFSQDEALALVVGLTLLRSMRSRPFTEALDTAEKKLVGAVPEALGEILMEAQARIGFEMPQADIFHPEPELSIPSGIPGRSPAQPSPDAVVQVYLQGVFHRRAVSLHYRSPYSARAHRKVILPLGALWDREYWYLVGKEAGGHADTRFWRADRVMEIQLESPTVETEPGFDIRGYLGRKWLEAALHRWTEEAPVQIRLTEKQASLLRKDWYYAQAVYQPLSDTQTLLSFGSDDVESVLDLLRWLGTGAELIQPPAWRALIQAQLAEMLEIYNDSAH